MAKNSLRTSSTLERWSISRRRHVSKMGSCQPSGPTLVISSGDNHNNSLFCDSFLHSGDKWNTQSGSHVSLKFHPPEQIHEKCFCSLNQWIFLRFQLLLQHRELTPPSCLMRFNYCLSGRHSVNAYNRSCVSLPHCLQIRWLNNTV